MRNSGRVLTRGQLINRVWGVDYFGDTKTLDVHIKRLRSKIENDPSMPAPLLVCAAFGCRWSSGGFWVSVSSVVGSDVGPRSS